MPGSRREGRGTAAHGHRDTGTRSARRVPAPPPRARRCAAPPRPARPIPPMGAGPASNAAGHWCGPARPEPIPAAPATRWRRGAEWARRARHVGAHGCSPGRAGRPRAAAPGRAHPEVAGPGRVSVRGEAPERQPLAPPCRGASLGPARSGAARGGVRGALPQPPCARGPGRGSCCRGSAGMVFVYGVLSPGRSVHSAVSCASLPAPRSYRPCGRRGSSRGSNCVRLCSAWNKLVFVPSSARPSFSQTRPFGRLKKNQMREVF